MPATCDRCHETLRPIRAELPLPADLAREVRDRTCDRCWSEWGEMEVMVINELRLNFMDPEAQNVLHHRMREFLGYIPTAE